MHQDLLQSPQLDRNWPSLQGAPEKFLGLVEMPIRALRAVAFAAPNVCKISAVPGIEVSGYGTRWHAGKCATKVLIAFRPRACRARVSLARAAIEPQRVVERASFVAPGVDPVNESPHVIGIGRGTDPEGVD